MKYRSISAAITGIALAAGLLAAAPATATPAPKPDESISAVEVIAQAAKFNARYERKWLRASGERFRIVQAYPIYPGMDSQLRREIQPPLPLTSGVLVR